MPYSFIETNELAKRFQKEERRHVYSTPKSFLEMLKLYQVLLEHKRDTSDYSIGRLKAGLQKMQETADAVAEIEAGLKITLEDAEVKKTKAEVRDAASKFPSISQLELRGDDGVVRRRASPRSSARRRRSWKARRPKPKKKLP